MASTANSASAANQAATANGPTAANSVTILEQGRVGGIGDVGRGAGKPAAGGGGGGATVLTDVGVVGDTSALAAKTNENEAFIAYNDETFQLWVSSGQTTASVTIYTKQNSGPE